jgi:uncharacterized membrane protein
VITAVLTGAVFLTLAFLGSSGRLPPPASVALALFPPLAGVVAVCWHTRARWVALAGMAGVLAFALAYSSSLAAHVSTLWFVEHVSINLLLAAFFGRTLLPGAEPLITRIARAMRPSMPQEVVEYTRAVTAAWTIYFMVMAALSIALYFGSSIAVWSAFATFVSGPGVALMFLFEFALRRRRVPGSHASIAQSIAGFRALVQAPGGSSRRRGTTPDA